MTLRFDAVKECLATLAEHAARPAATRHMPRIDCGLGAGTWDEVEPVVDRALTACGVATTAHDLA